MITAPFNCAASSATSINYGALPLTISLSLLPGNVFRRVIFSITHTPSFPADLGTFHLSGRPTRSLSLLPPYPLP